MQLLFAKSNWERNDLSLAEFLPLIKEEGYHCAEIAIAGLPDSPAEIKSLHAQHNLLLIAQLHTSGPTISEHLASLEILLEKAAATGAFLINLHTGKDYFQHEENVRLFRRATEWSRQHGIPVVHETHRGRALFAAFVTRDYLAADPDIRLTADFSHWMTVHESDLTDQPEALAAAIARTDHLHARVGFSEGPQIADPFAPEHAALLEHYLTYWRAIVRRAQSEGREFLTVTPEAGPPPYMPVLPRTQEPLADTWQLNLQMLRFLAQELAA